MLKSWSVVLSCDPGDMELEKRIASLPLAQILEGEPHGGWGRTIRACVEAEGKLAKDVNMQSEACTLRAHISLVGTARQLQAAKLASRSDTEIEEGFSLLFTAGLRLPPAIQRALVLRRVKAVRTTLLQGEEPTPESLTELINVALPWAGGRTISKKPLEFVNAGCGEFMKSKERVQARKPQGHADLSECHGEVHDEG